MFELSLIKWIATCLKRWWCFQCYKEAKTIFWSFCYHMLDSFSNHSN